jgi:hypothetical protein
MENQIWTIFSMGLALVVVLAGPLVTSSNLVAATNPTTLILSQIKNWYPRIHWLSNNPIILSALERQNTQNWKGVYTNISVIIRRLFFV